METELLHQPLRLAVLGGGLVFFLGYFLQMAANLCGADQPTFRKAVLVAVLTAGASFLVYDLTGYAIFQSTRDSLNLNVPAGFSYANWLGEPLYLKWQVLGFVPGIRYLPLLFAVCLAAILYVLILKVPYRVSMVVFLLQWTLSIVSLAVLSFALNGFLSFFQLNTPSGVPGNLSPQAGGRPQFIQPADRMATRPGRRPASAVAPEVAPASGATLKESLANHQQPAQTDMGWLKQQVERLHQALEPYLEPIREATHPYTVYLPVVVQEFLDDGGWLLVIGALAVVVCIWARRLYRRVRRALFGKRKKRRATKIVGPQHIELREVGDALTDEGAVQATVRDRAVRLRVVVLAPAVSYIGDLLAEMAEGLLDYVKPGLADALDADVPRVVVWPRQPSEGRFQQQFFDNVEVPEARGKRSHWILLAGTIRLGRQKVHLGLAVYAELASNLREIRIEKENWEPVLGLQKTEETV